MKARIKRSIAALSAAVAASFAVAAADPVEGPESLLESLGAMLAATATEGMAGIERKFRELDPALARAATPFVAKLILDSRDEAVANGVEPIPANIRAELEGYVPDDVLDAARWCVGCGGALSLQQNTFRLGWSPAITLDYVVVFKSRDDALTDPSLWAHELRHVMQFREWGIEGFAARYLADLEAVERVAAEYRWEWMKQTDYLARRETQQASNDH